eukprot:1081863-Prymnesium_polylepis.1
MSAAIPPPWIRSTARAMTAAHKRAEGTESVGLSSRNKSILCVSGDSWRCRVTANCLALTHQPQNAPVFTPPSCGV